LRREVGAGEAIEDVAAEERGDPAGPLPEDVVSALASLSPDHRAVVVLRYVLEYTPGEIARMLELPRGTVNSRLRRGLDALQGAVRPEEER
jgi:RNA polymerase sigma-70 factor (ECF subfamily)